MSNRFNLQEIAIAISAKNLNPTALNLDFLKYSDIIPSDWEVARPSVYTHQLVQLIFQNGVGLVAQPNRVFFADIIGSRDPRDIQAAMVARQYVEKLSKLEYQSVGINLTGYVIYPSEDAAYQYLCQSLLCAGDWQKFGEAPMKAGLQLSYVMKRGQLNLGINQATITLGEQTVPGIVFSGNFNYDIVEADSTQQIQDLVHLIENWQTDLKIYEDLITQKFLSLSPDLLEVV